MERNSNTYLLPAYYIYWHTWKNTHIKPCLRSSEHKQPRKVNHVQYIYIYMYDPSFLIEDFHWISQLYLFTIYQLAFFSWMLNPSIRWGCWTNLIERSSFWAEVLVFGRCVVWQWKHSGSFTVPGSQTNIFYRLISEPKFFIWWLTSRAVVIRYPILVGSKRNRLAHIRVIYHQYIIMPQKTGVVWSLI